MTLVFDEFGNKHQSIEKSNCSKNLGFLDKNIFNPEKKNIIPKTIYDKDILLKNILKKNIYSTTIAITGHLHHGKSTFANLLASSVHLVNNKFLMDTFSNQYFIEQERNLTIYPNLITLLLFSKKKPKIFNFLDCPGHPDFQDQLISSLEISDGVILIIDLVEGVMMGTEISLRNAITRGLPLVVVLNAIDRLVLEFNSSPKEVHRRILVIIDEINMIIQKMIGITHLRRKKQFKYFNPLLNNVCFSSVVQGWTFTLEQFSEIYISSQPSCCLSTKDLVFSIWNCVSFLKNVKTVSKTMDMKKGFLFQDLILCPLIKLIFFNLTENFLNIRKFIESELGIHKITSKEISLSSEKILNFCISLFLGGCRDLKMIHNHSGLINSLEQHISLNKKNAPIKNWLNERSKTNWKFGFFTIFFNLKKSTKTVALCKILDGKIRVGDALKVITTDAYFYKNQKYLTICLVKNLSISVARYMIKISKISKNNLVLLEGLEYKSKESGIFIGLYTPRIYFDWFKFSLKRSLINSQIEKIIKVLIKPKSIKNLKPIFKIFRICSQVYPNLNCLIKSNGNIILSATSELYLDCVLENIKEYLGEIEFDISAPYLSIKEIISNDEEYCSEFSNNELILCIKNSSIKKMAMFPILGFLSLFEKASFLKKAFLINSISGGYLSYILQKKQGLSKKNSNSIWITEYDSINLQNSYLRAKIGLNFSAQEKSLIISEFKQIFSKGSTAIESLGKIEFILAKGGCYIDSSPYKLSCNFKEELAINLSRIRTICQEPSFLGEIILPDNYLSIVLKYLKKKLAKITSYDTFFWEKIVIIRIQILGSIYLDFEKELFVLTQGETRCFFLFDSWKNSF